jgi:polyribonucleotide nucleotidyltransferase
VGAIVGKGGSNLRAIEAEHKVSIEIDGQNDGSLRILGQESGG